MLLNREFHALSYLDFDEIVFHFGDLGQQSACGGYFITGANICDHFLMLFLPLLLRTYKQKIENYKNQYEWGQAQNAFHSTS